MADVQATLEGDEHAYARLVHRYQKPIAAYLWRFARDRHDWEDLVQEVFIQAYVGLARYSAKAPLLHWLKRIATRIGYRYWKRCQRRQREVPLSAEVDLVPSGSGGSDDARRAAEVVHQLLAELKPRDRLVLTLTYLEECSVKETAELTGWTSTMVKVQTHRARRRLAKICEQKRVAL